MPETIRAYLSLQCLSSSLSSSEIMALIDNDTITKIKATDPHPFFQAYSICHEGTSRPSILGDTARPIHWTRAAVQSIKNIILKGIKFFKGHNADNSTENRESLGEIVASTEREINGKLHHIAVGYFPNKEKVSDSDICSQEANWNLFEQAGHWFAGTIDKLTGIALSNSKVDKPAFADAKRLGMVQAFVLQGGGPGSGRKPYGKKSDTESKEDVEKSIKATDNIGNVESKAGYVSISKTSDTVIDDEGEESQGDEYLEIDLVYTKPEYRGQGYAEKMLDKSLDVAEKTGLDIKLVALPKDAKTSQSRLVDFYTSMGFSSTDEQGGSGIIMSYDGHNARERLRGSRKKIRAQAFNAIQGDENKDKKDIGNMPEELKTVPFAELVTELKRRNTFPTQVFSLDEIKKDREISPIFEKLDKLEKDIQVKDKSLNDLEEEKKTLSKQINSVTAKDRLVKILDENKLIPTTDKQRKFIKERFKNIEDTSDEGLKKYIQSEIDERKRILDIEGIPEKENDTGNTKTPTGDMTKAENNPLLEEDFNANI